jgi:asparagine synthase (glutamine-hydrolysing)
LAGRFNLVELMAAADLNQYLPEDILTKLDRASMAVSLESRVPLLDEEVVAFALSLPLSFKRTNGQGKLVLRQVLAKYLPRELFERPKQGFSVPISAWIRGPLRDWAENLLEAGRRNHADLLDTDVISRKWQEHLRGRHDWENLLWPVLMFESWAEKWI